MPQGRIILKSISESKKLSKLKTDGARLLYTWLIPHLDVNGSFSADPDVVNGKVLTRLNKSRKTIESYLDDLENNHLILRFTTNGDVFLNVPDFIDKQPNLRPEKEGKPNIPVLTPDLLPAKSDTSKVKESKVNISKVKERHLEFIFLTSEEYQKLIDKFGQKATDEKIQILNDAIGSKGYKYKSHYHTILNWDRRDKAKETNAGKTKLYPIKPTRSCGVDGCSMPAVHKVVGEFDHYYCWEHIPQKIKAKMQEQYYV